MRHASSRHPHPQDPQGPEPSEYSNEVCFQRHARSTNTRLMRKIYENNIITRLNLSRTDPPFANPPPSPSPFPFAFDLENTD
jgi:hypothetical protein